MISSREVALKALVKTEKDNSYVNLILPAFLQRLPDGEKAFARNITYGTIKYLNTIDWIIGLHIKRSLNSFTPFIRNILRSAVYQIFFLDNIPQEVTVDQSVKLSYRYGHKGVAGLVNAVLRKVTAQGKDLPWPEKEKDPALFYSLFYSFPLWMVKRWINNFGLEETADLCRAYNKIPPVTLRTNTLKISTVELVRILSEDGITTSAIENLSEGLTILSKSEKPLNTIESYKEGLFSIQGESSMIAGRLMAPMPGKKVVDLCSAPGGKTTHMAEIMRNRGEISAGDIHSSRLKLVHKQAMRLGITIIHPQEWDGTEVFENTEQADYVLCDAPCSGIGVINRKPDLKWHKTEAQIMELSRLQLKLLKTASSLVKSGGKLLYCVCTNEPEETWHVTDAFIRENHYFKPFVPEFPIPLDEKHPGTLVIYPHIHQKDGFFMALFQKK